MHLGNKLRAAVLYSIHFLDQWLVKGHSHHTEARNPKGKCPSQVCTLPFLRFSFCCTQLIPRRQSKGVRLNSKDLRGSRTQTGGGNLLPRVSWLPRLVASHMICFSHQRERDCPRPLICFSHDLDLWVFAQRLSHGHKDIFLFFFFTVVLHSLKGNRKYQTFTSSFGYPPAYWGMIPLTCVEDNESSCAPD